MEELQSMDQRLAEMKCLEERCRQAEESLRAMEERG